MLIAAVVALGAAVCFAGSSVLQSKAARCAPTAKLLRPGLLIDLLHRPRWLAGLAASVAGFGMQGLALHLGRLVLVQPLLLVELLFVVPFAGRAERGIASSARWITAGAIAGGLALFLTAAR
ncbi:MAG: DMT family transporter, partial [Mycobacterium sp.]|nr:DMT family transporter [Mycobacterium sp.]